ncbi:MAG TPA: hypothetical protein PKX92_13305 [Edaphocola sp.]|nr:hypothetical protein [Edaphocola sp.]
MSKLTLDEVKAKTLEFLKSTDDADVEHITQDLIEKDLASDIQNDDAGEKEEILNVYEGHNVRLQYAEGEYYWYYERGATQTGAGCGNDVTKRLPSSTWSGTSIGRCTGNDHKVRFTRH